jgi:hypothetical protein
MRLEGGREFILFVLKRSAKNSRAPGIKFSFTGQKVRPLPMFCEV